MDLEQKIKNYVPTEKTKEIIKAAKPVFLVGIAGAGKDTIKQALLGSGYFHDIVSHTTRAPRMNDGVMEVDGSSYHFIDLKTAEEMVDNKAFVEVKFVHGRVYGTSVREFEIANEESKRPITDIDVQGVDEYMNITMKAVPIFLMPPNAEVWLDRLRRRYASEEEFRDNFEERAKSAIFELNQVMKTGYYRVVVNDDLEKAIAEVMATIDIEHDNSYEDHKGLVQDLLNGIQDVQLGS